MAAITVRNLYKIFGKKPGKAIPMLRDGMSKDEILEKTGLTVAIDDASFEVREKEIFVIMGLSGSGKSTVLRCLNRLIEPTDGEIFLESEQKNIMDIKRNELLELRRRSMSMVFQNFGLFPHRTILNNVAYGLEIGGADKETRHEKAREAIDLVGLKGYEDKKPNELSGGMQQRVGLARALANNPEILLMDEAFSALDPLIRNDMQEELLELQAEMNKTIVFITHDLDEALKLGDRIAIMKDGRIVQIGTPETILTEPANEYVRAFVQNVDRTKIITAVSIMRKAPTVDLKKDGPGVATRKMEKSGVSTVYVLNGNRKYQGVVTIDDANRLKNEKIKSVDDIIRNDAHTTRPDTPIKQLLSKAIESRLPIAVVEQDGTFRGVVSRASIINEVNLNDTKKQTNSETLKTETLTEENTQ
ncbi:MAG: betaine/proline/choline family ABC transporter ATP-binding protein [Bacteroidetes bacterium]|jgi:glycine betaine/proline transport system ATP-binding protein|nr:betaine/proline/choline family ABC transporter ATP-binding protein [Bacteroidota bacterium]